MGNFDLDETIYDNSDRSSVMSFDAVCGRHRFHAQPPTDRMRSRDSTSPRSRPTEYNWRPCISQRTSSQRFRRPARGRCHAFLPHGSVCSSQSGHGSMSHGIKSEFDSTLAFSNAPWHSDGIKTLYMRSSSDFHGKRDDSLYFTPSSGQSEEGKSTRGCSSVTSHPFSDSSYEFDSSGLFAVNKSVSASSFDSHMDAVMNYRANGENDCYSNVPFTDFKSCRISKQDAEQHRALENDVGDESDVSKKGPTTRTTGQVDMAKQDLRSRLALNKPVSPYSFDSHMDAVMKYRVTGGNHCYSSVHFADCKSGRISEQDGEQQRVPDNDVSDESDNSRKGPTTRSTSQVKKVKRDLRAKKEKRASKTGKSGEKIRSQTGQVSTKKHNSPQQSKEPKLYKVVIKKRGRRLKTKPEKERNKKLAAHESEHPRKFSEKCVSKTVNDSENMFPNQDHKTRLKSTHNDRRRPTTSRNSMKLLTFSTTSDGTLKVEVTRRVNVSRAKGSHRFHDSQDMNRNDDDGSNKSRAMQDEHYVTPKEKFLTRYLLSSLVSLPDGLKRRDKKRDFYLNKFEKKLKQEVKLFMSEPNQKRCCRNSGL